MLTYRIFYTIYENMISFAQVSVVLAVLMFTWYIGALIFTKRRRYPPGPMRLPVIGNVMTIVFSKPNKLSRWLHKKYGNVSALYFGSSKLGAVVLSGRETINEALEATLPATSNPIVDRPRELLRLRGSKVGLSWANLQKCRHVRRWMARILKNFGSFNGSAVSKIDTALDDFLDVVDSNCGIPWNPRRQLLLSIGSITHQLLFGREAAPGDMATYMSDFATWSDDIVDESVYRSMVLPLVPLWNRIFPSMNSSETKFEERMERLVLHELDTRRMLEIARKSETAKVRRSSSETPPPTPRESPLPSSTPTLEHHDATHATDFIGFYLNQESLGKAVDLPIFCRILTDVMLGALQGVSDQIAWALYYLARMPDEQERLFSEIKDHVKLVNESPAHRNHCFTRNQAFLNETYRHSSIFPLIYLYETNHEMSLKGFTIPTDTQVWCSLYSIHYDRNYWRDPENFRIERWLTPDGGRLVDHSSHMVPFGLGNRACPFEQLARMETFAYVIGFIRNYRIGLADSAADLGFNNEENVHFMRKIPDKQAQFVFTKRMVVEELKPASSASIGPKELFDS